MLLLGQGCNQSLEDGPLLVSWLTRSHLTLRNISTRLRCFEREMIARISSKVLASRQAAASYHSYEAMNADQYGFEGITPFELKLFLQELQNKRITAISENLIIQTKDIVEKIRLFH